MYNARFPSKIEGLHVSHPGPAAAFAQRVMHRRNRGQMVQEGCFKTFQNRGVSGGCQQHHFSLESVFEADFR
jgi:hypothetical protein